MRRSVFALVLTSIVAMGSVANAQTATAPGASGFGSQGTFFVMGSLAHSSQKGELDWWDQNDDADTRTTTIRPWAGYFVVDRVSLGLGWTRTVFDLQDDGPGFESKTSNPFVFGGYHYPIAPAVFLYANGRLGHYTQSFAAGQFDTEAKGFMFGISGGLQVGFGGTIGGVLDVAFAYDRASGNVEQDLRTTDGDFTAGTVRLELGLGVFF